MYIYRTWITKNGVRIYAKDYGFPYVTFLPHIVNRKNKKRGEIDAV